jgi:hypothetical protein
MHALLACLDTRCLQEAELFQDAAHEASSFADHSWAAVYFGACALMWRETGEDRYELGLLNCAHALYVQCVRQTSDKCRIVCTEPTCSALCWCISVHCCSNSCFICA